MTDIFNSLDSRELATAIWLAIFIFWCLTKPGIRKSLRSLFSATTALPIVVSLTLAMSYITIATVILQSLDMWTIKQLKITVLWYFLAAIPSLMDTPEISKNPASLKNAIAKNFKLSLILDLFINLFKLPFLAELIFVPFSALLGGLLAVAHLDKKYAPVQKLLNGILILIGLVFLAYETYKITTSFDEIANMDTLRDFTLPLIYNIAFIPFLWAIAIYAAYDSVFSRLQFVIKDSSLHSYAKRRLIIRFRTDITSLNAWSRSAWSGALTSRSEIHKSISAAKSPGAA